jgi:hypothetical protein
MNRRAMASAAFVGLLLLATPRLASAQFGPGAGYGAGYGPRAPAVNPLGRPGLSPYLNLLRGGNPAANYYMGVVPEAERRYNARQFSSAIADLEQRTATPPTAEGVFEEELPPKGLPPTGHAATFLNASPYFGGTGALPRGTPTRRTTTAPPPRTR